MGAKIYPEGLLKTIPLNSPISEDRIVNKVFEISAKYGLQVKVNKEEVKMEGSFFEPKESAVTIYNSKFNTKYKFFALVQRQKGTVTYLYVYMAGKSDNNRKALMHDEQLKQGHFVGSLLFKPSGRAIEDEALYYNIMQNNVLPEAFNELMNENHNEYKPKISTENITEENTNTEDNYAKKQFDYQYENLSKNLPANKSELKNEQEKNDRNNFIDETNRYIKNMKFSKQIFNGYNINEVDNFLDEISLILEELKYDNDSVYEFKLTKIEFKINEIKFNKMHNGYSVIDVDNFLEKVCMQLKILMNK